MEAPASPPVQGRPSTTNRPSTRPNCPSISACSTNSTAHKQNPRFPRGFVNSLKPKGQKRYFFTASPALPYLRRKRSTRPAVSISFCLPVKNGWHAAQISTEISLFCVDRVTNWLPQAQCTRLSLYTG